MRELGRKRKAEVDAAVKESISKTVFEIIEEHPRRKVTIDMVSQQTGYSKGAIYQYFKDKNDLLAFAMTQALEPYWQRQLEIAESDLPVEDKLRASAEVSLECSDRMRQQLFNIFKSISAYSAKTLKAGNHRRVQKKQHLEGIMREGLHKGVLWGEALDLVHYFLGILRGFYWAREKTSAQELRPAKDDAIDAIKRFMHGIRQRGSDA